MKRVVLNYLVIAALAVSAAFTSCKKDDDGKKEMTMTTAKAEIMFELYGIGTVTIDWGDGSPKEIVTLDGLYDFNHNYSSEKLHTITITGDNIMMLHSTNIQLITLDASNNPELISLACWDNQLTNLNLNGLTKLEYLHCANNELTSLDVSRLINLDYLVFSNNKLKSLDVSQLTKLKRFSCGGNQFSSLDVSKLTNLEDLDIRENKFTSLNVSGLTKLKELRHKKQITYNSFFNNQIYNSISGENH